MSPFEKFFESLTHDTFDPCLRCAQRAWNAALEEAATHVSSRSERTAILIDAVHMDDLIQ